MLYIFLFGTSIGFAQPEEDSSAETSVSVPEPESEKATTQPPLEANPVETATLEPSSDITDANLLLVEMTLQNGIVLTGSMEFQQVLTWTPQSTEEIRLYMTTGIQKISGTTVASIVQVSEGPADRTEEPQQEIKESVEVPQGISSQDYAPVAGEFSFQNPAASRYLYAPSSIPLQKGQGYVSQKLIFTSGVLGITDNVTLLVGTTVPFPFVSIVGGKFAKQINDKWHVGAGTELFFFPFAGAFDDGTPTIPLGIGFVSATYGDLNSHVTVATGVAYEQVFSNGRINHPVMVAGHKRLSDRLAVVTENWLLLNLDIMADGRSPYTASINSLAFRFIGNRSQSYQWFGKTIDSRGYPRATWDFGLVFMNTIDAARLYDPVLDTTHYSLYSDSFTFGPIPWVDYTWHFGPARQSKGDL